MAKATPQSALGQLESVLEEYLVKKAPALPENVKEIIVKFAPWVTLIIILMLLPLILAALGIGAIAVPFSLIGGLGAGLGMIIALVGFGGTILLEVMALPGLFNRKRQGWNYAYYATLLNAVASVLQGNLVGGLLGAVIGLYFLFQVKSYYK